MHLQQRLIDVDFDAFSVFRQLHTLLQLLNHAANMFR